LRSSTLRREVSQLNGLRSNISEIYPGVQLNGASFSRIRVLQLRLAQIAADATYLGVACCFIRRLAVVGKKSDIQPASYAA